MGINGLCHRLRRPAGFNLVGFLSGGFGLAEASRNTLRFMLRKNIPVVYRDMDTMDHRTGQVQEFARTAETRQKYWPYGINLLHFNPPETGLLIEQWPETPLLSGLNAMVPFWELPSLHPEWVPCLNAMDCILAPTKYIQTVIQNELPGKTVLHFPQSVPVEELTAPDRKRFNLPEEAFILLCAFDIMSGEERKNPWGAIQAFQLAFPENPDVRLVLKIYNAGQKNSSHDLPGQLRQISAKDPRIILIENSLPRNELQTLYASCDALISLHRAEGLGLIIMEMMMQAKPVIVTGWSGNMDFTTPENSCLVDFRLVPVKTAHPSYTAASEHRNPDWAEADINCAAEWMKKLLSDREFRTQIGANARQSMLERAEMDRSAVFEALRKQYQSGRFGTPESRVYFKKLLEPVKKRQKRQQIRRIEKSFKRLFRR